MSNHYIVSHAVLSNDGLYRYVLLRRWDVSAGAKLLLIVMLNPSTADETKDDATIRSCVRLAKELGYGGIAVCNLFAYRATKPRELLATPYKTLVGSENDAWLEVMALQAHDVVAAWGAFVERGSDFEKRAFYVTELLRRHHPVHYFKLTRGGSPGHPLYLKSETKLVLWRPKFTVEDMAARGLAAVIERDTFRV